MTENSFMETFEHIGEALPQFSLAILFYLNNYDYVVATEFGIEIAGFLVTQTMVSIILSGISILKGIMKGIKSCVQIKAWRAEEVDEPQNSNSEV